MTQPGQLHVVTVPQLDPRLGRQCVHDPASRRFPFRATAEPPRRDVTLRVYQPSPLPNQAIGCCTGVDAAVKGDTAGNRVRGRILGMADALRIYTRATQLDPFPGSYPPNDTGSSSLGACKAQTELGLIDGYSWIFDGTDGILAALTQGHPVGVGTWWYESMFNADRSTGLVEVSGRKAGGHQWTVIGYRRRYDAFIGQCWWSENFGIHGRFLIRRQDLADLLADDGDAHITHRKIT